MTYIQYERKIYVTIGPLAQDSGTRINDLRMNLNLVKTSDCKKNNGTIKIYNLKNETIEDIKRNPPLGVTVEAGYKGNEGIIFIGAVMGMHVEYTRSDVILNIKVSDGSIKTTNIWFSKSYAGKTKPSDVLNDILSEMKSSNSKLIEGIINANSASDYQNGFVWNGYANDALNRICLDNNLNWFISDSIINIVGYETPLNPSNVPFLNVDSGLIGSPEYHEEKVGKRKDKHTEKGIKFKCLLNPDVSVGNEVQIQSRFFNDNYLVKKIVINADNYEGNFLMEVIAINEWL